jgi:hypothetical protein
MKDTFFSAIAVFFMATSSLAIADSKPGNSKDNAASKPASPHGGDYQVVRSSSFNFEETMIDGKMKSPNGFLLEGRKRSSQQNMIQLRTNFNQELLDSKAAVMAVPTLNE